MDRAGADKRTAIGSHPLFKELSDREVELISRAARKKIITNNVEFIRQGETAKEVFFILSGGVRVYLMTEEGREVTLALLGAGDVIGEMAFLNDEPRSASARTIQETVVVVLAGEDFRNILRSNPDTAVGMLRILSNRIRITDRNLEDIYARSLSERTLKILESLSGCLKKKDLSLSQEDLAVILGATRPRVSEALAALKKEGKVDYTRKQIRLL